MSEIPPETPPEEPPPETPPEPEPAAVDEGDVCEVCGRRGRAEGHH